MSLLPINATPQEVALEQSTARISDVPTPLREVWNPNTCPASLLPWLAWALSVDEWNPTWTDDQKRNIIRSSVEIHRHKGTIGSVRRVAESFGLGLSIQEWWQKSPQGTPHTFSLIVSADQIPSGALATVIESIKRVKPVRSDFDVSYVAGYLAQVNTVVIVQPTVYDRFEASLN